MSRFRFAGRTQFGGDGPKHAATGAHQHFQTVVYACDATLQMVASCPSAAMPASRPKTRPPCPRCRNCTLQAVARDPGGTDLGRQPHPPGACPRAVPPAGRDRATGAQGRAFPVAAGPHRHRIPTGKIHPAGAGRCSSAILPMACCRFCVTRELQDGSDETDVQPCQSARKTGSDPALASQFDPLCGGRPPIRPPLRRAPEIRSRPNPDR